MSTWSQLLFQDANSPTIFQLIIFHDHSILILTLILSIVSYFFFSLFINSFSSRYTLEAQEIEIVWTILPALILLFLALPSLRLLYLIDESPNPSIRLKTIGHQWFWSYEYSDFINLEFDSYILPDQELSSGDFRLLEVDNRAVLPIIVEVRALVTAADVIHSWTIPSLGVKADAFPGRLNQLTFTITRPGVFFGQCSEICGANHSFIPIVIESVNLNSFINWIKSSSS